MPEKLGRILVDVNEEGAQDAVEGIAEASSEVDDGGSGGTGSSSGSGGGGLGDMLGGISKKLIAILGFVAFLASLKPIQELLGGIQRLFSTAILPLVALLMTFLRPLLQDLLRFIADLDFNNLIDELARKLPGFLKDITADALENTGIASTTREAQSIADTIGTFFVGDEDTRSAFAGMGGTISQESLDKQMFFADLLDDDSQEVNVTGFREQSNTTLDQNATETTNKNTLDSGPGGQNR